jgi:hypothetical protein
VEQREGRIIRAGNLYADKPEGVEIYRFIAEPREGKVMRRNPETHEMEEMDRPRAYDLQMYQQLACKQHFIEQFWTGE